VLLLWLWLLFVVVKGGDVIAVEAMGVLVVIVVVVVVVVAVDFTPAIHPLTTYSPPPPPPGASMGPCALHPSTSYWSWLSSSHHDREGSCAI